MAEKNTPDVARETTRKEWRRPELRKLPITATSGHKGGGNEGVGVGKGDASKIS